MFRLNIAFFSKFYRGEQPGFELMGQVPTEARPMLGAAVCGLVASKYPQVLFFGYETLDLILKEEKPGGPLSTLTLTVLKLVLTAQALGSGLVGGIFAPSLFLGATLGSTFEGILTLLPTNPWIIISNNPTYAMIGAAAVLAATFRAPITAVILMFELTQEYSVIAPLMAAAGLAILTIDLLEPDASTPTWSWWWQPTAPPQDAQPFGRLVYMRLREAVNRQVLNNNGDALLARSRIEALEVQGVLRLEDLRELLGQMTPPGSAKYLAVRVTLDRLAEDGVTALGAEEIEAILVAIFPRAFTADAKPGSLTLIREAKAKQEAARVGLEEAMAAQEAANNALEAAAAAQPVQAPIDAIDAAVLKAAAAKKEQTADAEAGSKNPPK